MRPLNRREREKREGGGGREREREREREGGRKGERVCVRAKPHLNRELLEQMLQSAYRTDLWTYGDCCMRMLSLYQVGVSA